MPHVFNNYNIQLEVIFVDNFPSNNTNDNIESTLKYFLCNKRLNHSCELFNQLFLIGFFIRFKILTTI